MRHVLLILVFVGITAVQGSRILADEVVTSDRVANFVNVREEPFGESRVVGALRPGERADLVGSVPRWYHVRLAGGVEGYVSKSWTDVIAAVPGSSPFEVHFLDVGTGDAAIIDVGDREVVIDGGNSLRVLHDYARDTGIIDGPIELVVVTHADSDHWKGLNRLLGHDDRATEPHAVVEFWEPGYDRGCRPLDSYDAFIADTRDLPGVTVRRPLQATHVPADVSGTVEPFTLPSLPGVTFTLLHSDGNPDASDCAYRINDASIVLMVEVSGIRFLFTGDANGKERREPGSVTPSHVEAALLALEEQHPGTLKADVLKVPHHGSETASTDAFIAAVDPEYVIISASTTHHLPRPSVVARYDDGARVILRTDRDRRSDRDHVVCGKNENAELVCNYLDQLGGQ